MKVLVIGGGGREDALARKIAESPLVSKVYCAPGNAGTSKYATNVDISANDIVGLVGFAEREGINLTVVGPEDPLVKGIVDVFEKKNLNIFGPRASAAILEGSKVFMKKLLENYKIPTAKYAIFDDPALAEAYLLGLEFPVVVKAEGLAGGKGVYICENLQEAKRDIRELMVERKYGDAGNRIIIEEFLDGEEASYIVFVDKNGHILPLASSQDHKKVGNGDKGKNTGGMGAYSPAPVVTDEVERRIIDRIIRPVVEAMIELGRPFTGFLYAGLMIDKLGNPKVLEFNVRSGDPETQPILMRMKSDIVQIMLAALGGNLDTCEIEWDPRMAVCVTMAADGYPGPYRKGFFIDGILEAEATGATVYHAGTMFDEYDRLVSIGGRVLGVAALGDTFAEAQRNAYRAVKKIESGGNLFYRDDIADRAVNQ